MIANSVADTSHHNGRVNFPRSVASGLIGVIQKATQGEAYVDQTLCSTSRDNAVGTTMPLEEKRAFVTHIHQELNRWPGFYSGHTIKRVLGGVDPVLRNCWFWLAQYGPTTVVPHCWSSWTLWQYTDGGVGPRLTTSPASVIATGTYSKAMTRNCGAGGARSRLPPPRDERPL